MAVTCEITARLPLITTIPIKKNFKKSKQTSGLISGTKAVSTIEKFSRHMVVTEENLQLSGWLPCHDQTVFPRSRIHTHKNSLSISKSVSVRKQDLEINYDNEWVRLMRSEEKKKKIKEEKKTNFET